MQPPVDVPIPSPALPSATIQAAIPSPEPSFTPPPAPTAEEPEYIEPVWVINMMDKTLVHIDPLTNQVAGGLKLDGEPVAVTSGQAGVWAVARMTDKLVNILRIDPETYRVAAITPLHLENIIDLALSGDALWAAATRVEADGITPIASGRDFAGELIRIDPLTNSLATLLPLPALPRQVIFQDGALWVLEETGVTTRFSRIDPATQQRLFFPLSTPSMDFVYQFARFTRTSSSLWGISMDRRARFIYQVDPSDGRLVKIIEVGAGADDTPVDLTSAGEHVWVALHSGSAILVDASTGVIKQRVALEYPPDKIFSAAGAIWVQSHSEAKLERIEPSTGQVVAQISTGNKLRSTSTPWPELSPGEVCQGIYPTHLALYERAHVSLDPPTPNRVRAEPNQKSKIIGEIQPGQGMTIIEGPVCTDGWIWWKIQADETNLIGWTAEGDGNNYWLNPE